MFAGYTVYIVEFRTESRSWSWISSVS